MPLRMRVHDREPIGAALRRFKKLLERSGVTKELRKRKYYDKPCEARRRAKRARHRTGSSGRHAFGARWHRLGRRRSCGAPRPDVRCSRAPTASR